MPRMMESVFETTVFLFPTEEDAHEGRSLGGSGFILGIKGERFPDDLHVYAITNEHVAISGGASVIRYNTKDGGADCIVLDPSEWHKPTTGEDLAAYQIFSPPQNMQYLAESIDMAATQSVIDEYSLGAGDEVFSIGRFVDLDMPQRNRPVTRFGNVAMMPEHAVRIRGVGTQYCYLVEMRSRTGYSGSPVYIYIPPSTYRWQPAKKELVAHKLYGPWLLGVQCAQFPITGPEAPAESEDDLSRYGSGISGVIPIQRLTDFLMNDDKLKQQRRVVEDHWSKLPVANAESALPTKADNPSHKEDFNRLLSSVATGKSRGDQT